MSLKGTAKYIWVHLRMRLPLPTTLYGHGKPKPNALLQVNSLRVYVTKALERGREQ